MVQQLESPSPFSLSAISSLLPIRCARCLIMKCGFQSSYFSPFSALGQSPEACSSYTFPLLLGQLRAADFLLFGRKLSAFDALNWGLVNEV